MRNRTVKMMNSSLSRKRRSAKLSFILLLMMIGAAGTAQNIDSLKALLAVETGQNRCDILYGLAYEYVDVDNAQGLYYASEALKLSMLLGDSARMVKAGRIKALAFKRLEMLDSSIILFTNMLPIARRQRQNTELKHILNSLGMLYSSKARYDKALETHLESLQLRELDGDPWEVAIAINNIGYNYYKLEDYAKALSYFERILDLAHDAPRGFPVNILLLNVSLCHTYMENFVQAQQILQQLMLTCDGKCAPSVQASVAFNRGVIAFLQEMHTDSRAHFLESYDLAKRHDDKRLVLDNIIYLGQIFVHTRQLDLAEQYLKEGEELIAQGIPYNLELIKIYRGLYSLYERSGEYRKVAYYQQKYIQLKDSIYDEELTRNLMKVEAAYLERENQAKIESQSEILALNQAIIFRQRMTNIFIGIIASLLIVLAVVLHRGIREKKMANAQLEARVRERTSELEASRDSVQRSLDERTVVFRKMSVEIRSSLATILGLCALGLMDTRNGDRDHYIRKIERTSDHLLEMLRRTFANASVLE